MFNMLRIQHHTIVLFTKVGENHGRWCSIRLREDVWTHPGETFAVISKYPVICAQAITFAASYIQNCFAPVAGVPSTVWSTPCRVRQSRKDGASGRRRGQNRTTEGRMEENKWAVSEGRRVWDRCSPSVVEI